MWWVPNVVFIFDFSANYYVNTLVSGVLCESHVLKRFFLNLFCSSFCSTGWSIQSVICEASRVHGYSWRSLPELCEDKSSKFQELLCTQSVWNGWPHGNIWLFHSGKFNNS